MLKKLRIKFVVFSMSIVVVMLGVIFGTVYHFTARSLEAESRQLVQRLLTEPGLPGPPMRPEHRPEELHLPYFVLELNEQGQVIGSSGGYYDLSDEEFVARVLEQVIEMGKNEGTLEEYSLRFARGSTPMGQKIVFVDNSIEATALRSLGWSSILIGAGSLLAFFGLSLLLAHFAVKPVERAWQQQRQFVADASHELKTPLTVIMTSAELMQSANCDEDERRRFSDSILTMSRQMRGLVEGLLELARVDGGSAGADFEELDFSVLVSDAILPFEPLFFEGGLELESELAPGLRLRGSRRQLCQVLDILLDNALKYSSSGGRVSVSLQRQGCHCLLAVKSPGESMSREELRDIFKRFYRSDKARGLSGSYGLGLPIASGIVSAHRGRIWAESQGGVNGFFVALPVV